MKCAMCGVEMGEGMFFCPTCGAKAGTQGVPGGQTYAQQSQQGQYQPNQGQYQPQQGQYPQQQYQPYYVDRGKSSKVVGILALIFGCLGGLVGIILGCIGMGMSSRVLAEEPGNRSAQAGRICSMIGLILGAVIMIAVMAANA